MAVYKSSHKGSQVDEAVTIANGNKNKGNVNLPIYYDANGVGQSISVDTSATANSNKLLTGGGMYNGLTPKLSNNEIQTTVNTSGLPPSQGAAKKYTDTQVGTLQDPLISSDTINVGSDGKISVTDGVLRRGTSKLDEKVDHFAEYGIGDDSTVLSEMDEAAHSTFCGVNGSGESDPKKFTKVGSPIVTSDGVASGFSSGNGIETPTFDFSKPWKISDSFKLLSSPTETVPIIKIVGRNYTNVVYFDYLQNKVVLIVYTSSLLGAGQVYAFSLNTDYNYEFGWTGTEYYFYLYQGNTQVVNISISSTEALSISDQNRKIILGIYPEVSSWVLPGSIDLKQFSVTVDGVEVFSGNKTGMDTIKPDDYETLSGTPTVSADGIVTNSSGSTFALRSTSAYNMSGIKHIEFITPIYTVKSTPASNWFPTSCGDNSTGCFVLGLYSNGNIQINYNNTGGTGSNTNTPMPLNKPFQVKYEIIGTTINFYYRVVGNDWTLLKTTDNITAPTSNVKINIAAMTESNGNTYVDLNGCQLYFEGDLVYQPCLKIPYTLSSDGKKIVDNYYRPRVEDEYNQAGYTPYYTLQRELGDNYTIIGSPTITNGVASGFSSSNYINTGYTLNPTGNWKLKVGFTTSSDITTEQCITAGRTNASSNYGITLSIVDEKVRCWFGDGSTHFISGINSSNININTYYLWECTYINGVYTLYLNGTLYYTKTDSTKIVSNNAQILGSDLRFTTYPMLGSIDLNAFKIYVDNKLVYTAGRNYTLSTVEEEDIISSAENGVSMYTQRANLALEQTGSCTANTAYTFPKPFMNADYALSIPYTSGTKTATGFTPAESGEYIAEGLGKLY